MVDQGLDEDDPEAVDYAANILQAEYEVYHARQQAQQTGHRGFWSQGRNFQVSGNLSFEERKARVQSARAVSLNCQRRPVAVFRCLDHEPDRRQEFPVAELP